MTDDLSALDNLRPEVREAMTRLECYLHITIDGKHFRGVDYDTIRAELLRLSEADVELRAWINDAEQEAGRWQSRAEKAEAELAALKAEMDQLRADAETGKAWRTDSSLEEWFPLTAAELKHVKAELAAIKARIAGAELVRVERHPAGAVTILVSERLHGKRVRLLVEN